jgi:hypothetical protein
VAGVEVSVMRPDAIRPDASRAQALDHLRRGQRAVAVGVLGLGGSSATVQPKAGMNISGS